MVKDKKPDWKIELIGDNWQITKKFPDPNPKMAINIEIFNFKYKKDVNEPDEAKD